MLERSDLLALHEPLEGLAFIGPLEIASRRFATPESLVEWLLDGTTTPVFLKETCARPVVDLVRADPRFLAQVRHAFLIRRPEEIAASFFALEGDMRIYDTGIEALHDVYVAVRDAGGHQPVVIDSDDLVARPEATMRAYCAAVGLKFDADMMSWEAGVRPEWRRTVRWHQDASASTRFFKPTGQDRHALESHPEVLRFAARHRIFYERLRAERIRLAEAEQT